MRKLWILPILFLTACQSVQPSDGPVSQAQAESITCTAAYRSDVSQGIEREESISFGDSRGEEAIPFSDMVFHAVYNTGVADNERNLRVWVTSADSDEVILTQLYQLEQGSGPVNQFIGGHGFTGLGYVYHPTSSAELQFWCAAE